MTRCKKIDIVNYDTTKTIIYDYDIITRYDHENKIITFEYKHDTSKTLLCSVVAKNSSGYIGYKQKFIEKVGYYNE